MKSLGDVAMCVGDHVKDRRGGGGGCVRIGKI